MRKLLVLLATVASTAFSACTVKSSEAPPLAGPSTFAKDLNLKASPDILIQNGVSESVISVEAKDPTGKGIAMTLRAEIQINGVTQDFGSITNKRPSTDSSGRVQFVYRVPSAPPPGVIAPARVVTIAVTPESADFGGETTRSVDIQLLPQGTIGNSTLSPSFTISPAAPLAFEKATFDASATTSNGVACGLGCSYAWDFGDGTTGAGLITTHEFRTAGIKTITLTAADAGGFQASTFRNVTIGAPTPPTASFVVSPTGSSGVGQDVFFNASTSRPAVGRTIVSYSWNFGDGSTGSGVTTSHRFSATGTYNVVLTVTDDAGASAQAAPATVTVISGAPIASLTFLPATPKVNQPVAFDASTSTAATGSSIVSYTFNWGDGGVNETSTVGTQTHAYGSAGNYVATVVVTDSLGRTSTKQVSVPVVP
jgi:PKD repeat protein